MNSQKLIVYTNSYMLNPDKVTALKSKGRHTVLPLGEELLLLFCC